MAGPTHCTKLKVYRPKTCGVVPKPLDRLKYRPHTCVGEKEKMGAMDLAICWDYRPANPNDEPKRPAHIDGSNGSSAPAIFTLVKTPRTPAPTQNPNTGRSGGVFSNTLGEHDFFDKDIMRRNSPFGSKSAPQRNCTCGRDREEVLPVINYRPRSMSRYKEHGSRHRRCKSSPNFSQLAQASEMSSINNDRQMVQQYTQEPVRKLHRHRTEHISRHPQCDLTKHIKSQRLCEQHAANMPNNHHPPQPKPEYKQAFKAGIPNSNSSGTCTSFDSGCSSMSSSTCCTKTVKIPKPRNPYAKKDYVIDTLAPPFSCWRGGAGQGGYPEHWRLASVYQHAYKPVEQRKRPLLATVYQ